MKKIARIKKSVTTKKAPNQSDRSRSFREAAAVMLGLEESATESAILVALGKVTGAIMRASSVDYDHVRPWPSAEMRKLALDACARTYWNAPTEKVDVNKVRGMLTVIVKDGPAVTCTEDEFGEAIQNARGKSPVETPEAMRARLLANAVAWPVPANFLDGMLGRTLINGGNGQPSIVADEHGHVYAVSQEFGDAVTVRQVGTMVGDRPEPRMSVIDDGGDEIPAFDDIEALEPQKAVA